MADNVTYQTAQPATPPGGTIVAADDVGGVIFQKVKLDIGIDGATAPVTPSNPMPFGSLPFGADYMSATYTGDNPTTIVYKVGGSGGTTVRTKVITYDGSNNILTITET